jgi:hypothetical protein
MPADEQPVTIGLLLSHDEEVKMPFCKCPECKCEHHLSVSEPLDEWYDEHTPDLIKGELPSILCFKCHEETEPYKTINAFNKLPKLEREQFLDDFVQKLIDCSCAD